MSVPYRGGGVPTQPAPPEAAEAEKRGETPAQDVEYEFPPTKVIVVELPKVTVERVENDIQFSRYNVIRSQVGEKSFRILGARKTRTRAVIRNRGSESVILGHDENVTPVSGYRLEAGDEPLPLFTTKPIYACLDPAGTQDVSLVMIEEFTVPYRQ